MNWLLVLFIIILIGMSTYPIMMLAPTKRDKERILLRKAVMAAGIGIEVRNPYPLLPEKLQNQYDRLKQTVGYSLSCPRSVLNQNYIAVRSNQPNEWFWINGKRPPTELMQTMLDHYRQLPDYCLAVEQGQHASVIFTRENFSVEKLDSLLETLTKLNKLICKQLF